MAAIRSRGNKDTEVKLAAILRASGITGWRRHQALPGRPDFTFRRERLAIFVDGCFWHGCPEHGTWPKNNAAFWREKIERNMARDAETTSELQQGGWLVLRLWEHTPVDDAATHIIASVLSRRELIRVPISQR